MIHIDEELEERDGMLYTVAVMHKNDSEVENWLEDKSIFEAWIYNNTNGVRVVSWYE